MTGQRSRLRRVLVRCLMVLLLVASGLVAGASPAAASTCAVRLFGGYYVCGVLVNNSNGVIFVGGGGPPDDPNNTHTGWCTSNTKPIYTTNVSAPPPPCTSTNFLGSYVNPGESSGRYITDADSFEVAANCRVSWTATNGGSQTTVTDRRGTGRNEWIKFGDTTTITINSEFCGSSPVKDYVTTFATATGYQTGYCWYTGEGANSWCGADGILYGNVNYVFCKIYASQYPSSGSAWNHYWLLTDLDVVNSGRDDRAYVSAYFLTGAKNQANDTAYDNNGNPIPNC